jgi:hypothetical protein
MCFTEPGPVSMGRVRSSEVYEAEELLKIVRMWSEEEIEELPELYRRKARELQQKLGDV